MCLQRRRDAVTLRFGVRAKSIKNKARVNAELSPAVSSKHCSRKQRPTTNDTSSTSHLEAELKTWRSGGKVPESEWADASKVVVGQGAPVPSPALAPTPSLSRPITPAVENLRELASRPETHLPCPSTRTSVTSFCAGNELSDQIAEKRLPSRQQRVHCARRHRNWPSTANRRPPSPRQKNHDVRDQHEIKLQLKRVTYSTRTLTSHSTFSRSRTRICRRNSKNCASRLLTRAKTGQGSVARRQGAQEVRAYGQDDGRLNRGSFPRRRSRSVKTHSKLENAGMRWLCTRLCLPMTCPRCASSCSSLRAC